MVAGSPLSSPHFEFSYESMSDEQICDAIHAVPASDHDEELVRVKVTGASGQHNAMMRLKHPVRVQVEGHLGDYAFAMNQDADIRLTGSVRHGAAEGMASGAVRVQGNADVGAGTAMTGGTLAIFGNAGPRCGAAMRSGSIFVRGDVGDEAGIGAIGGTIVIGGNAGHRLGDAVNHVAVFLRGKALSLADGVTEAPLRKREELRLGLLLINASIRGDAKEFRRIVPTALLQAEQAQRGEVSPNWR